jgi:hypothetical protein
MDLGQWGFNFYYPIKGEGEVKSPSAAAEQHRQDGSFKRALFEVRSSSRFV